MEEISTLHMMGLSSGDAHPIAYDIREEGRGIDECEAPTEEIQEEVVEGTRWSGADWATEKKQIILVGVGGIGSWLALSLSRIGHSLVLIDPDRVDSTNVSGGQLYRTFDVGTMKVDCVRDICRTMGCTESIDTFQEEYIADMGILPITITGLDNMKARKEVFEAWRGEFGDTEGALFIDGRLTLEMYEILCVQGGNKDQIREYEEKYLFDDSEVKELDCTTKQCTFGAMGIASMITASLCNHLTNNKLGMDFREVPFYQRMYMPILDHKKLDGETKTE